MEPRRNKLFYNNYCLWGLWCDLVLAVVGAAMLAADGAGGYSVSYTPVTMKLSITSTDASFYLRLSVQTNQMWATLGFTTAANTAPALTQTADSVIRLDHPPYLMIDISELPSQDGVNGKHNMEPWELHRADVQHQPVRGSV